MKRGARVSGIGRKITTGGAGDVSEVRGVVGGGGGCEVGRDKKARWNSCGSACEKEIAGCRHDGVSKSDNYNSSSSSGVGDDRGKGGTISRMAALSYSPGG